MAVVADPQAWANPGGALVFWAVVALIFVGAVAKLFAGRWDDWLDERWGRGSVRDWWLLREIERGDRPHR